MTLENPAITGWEVTRVKRYGQGVRVVPTAVSVRVVMAVAFYPGSFDPFHLGHLDVVEQAVSLFGELVIGVMHNPDQDSSGMFNGLKSAPN